MRKSNQCSIAQWYFMSFSVLTWWVRVQQRFIDLWNLKKILMMRFFSDDSSPLDPEVCQLIDTSQPEIIRLSFPCSNVKNLKLLPMLGSGVSIEYGDHSRQSLSSFNDIVNFCTAQFTDLRTIVTSIHVSDGYQHNDGETHPTFDEILRQMDSNSSRTSKVDLQIQCLT